MKTMQTKEPMCGKVAALVAGVCMAAAQTAFASAVYWLGTTDNQWSTQANWTGQNSARPLPTNDDTYFDGDRYGANSVVEFDSACTNEWKTYVRKTGLTPFIFRTTDASASFGLTSGNEKYKNNVVKGWYIADASGDADVVFESGAYKTMSYGNWWIGSASYVGNVVALDDVTLQSTYQFLLQNGSLYTTNATLSVANYVQFGYLEGKSTIVDKTGGDWSLSNTLFLGSGKNSTSSFFHRSGSTTVNAWICVGNNESSTASSAYLEISGGAITNTTGSLGIADKGALGSQARVCIKNGGAYYSAEQIVVGQHSSATLDIEAGGLAGAGTEVTMCGATAANATSYIVAGEDSAVNLSGTLVTPRVVCYECPGNATFNFKGGTLKAKASGNLILAASNLSVNICAEGGTIDAAGCDVAIKEDLAEDAGSTGGGMTFKGGGSVSLDGAIGWTGGTTIELGTCVKIPDAAAMGYLAANGIVVPTPSKLYPGQYPIVTLTGDGESFEAADTAKVSSFPSGTTVSISPDGKTLYIDVPMSLGDGRIVQEKTQLVFPGATLADLATHTLRARMEGDYFDCDGVETTFFNRQETTSGNVLTKVTYQLQTLDTSNVKAVKVEFTESMGGVYAKLIDGDYSNYGDQNAFGTDPLTANPGTNLYAPYDLQLVTSVSNSINVNFTYGGKNLNTTSSVRYGGGDYAVPYTEWVNVPSANGSTSIAGVTVTRSNVKNDYLCTDLSSSKDVRYGYIDDGNNTPTVTITGVPYAFYRIIAYAATDTADVSFGHITLNGVDYTGNATDGTVVGNSTWGATGARNKARGLREGVNYLVSPITSGQTATIVGHKAAPARGCIAAVQIVEAVPSAIYTATIGDGGSKTLTGLSWDNPLPSPIPSDAKLVINVEEDTALDVDVAVNAPVVEFNVADGKTLTLSGNTVTAVFVNVNGPGEVVAGSASQFTGTLRGNGTLVYATTPSGLVFTDSEWNGVLWLKNCAIAGLVPANMANANSTLRLTGVTGYFNSNPGSTATPQISEGTLELVDDGATNAFVVDNGWSTGGITVFEKLKGNGTLGVSSRDIAQRYVFKDVSEFSGTINLASRPLRVILGDGASLSPENGTITVASGATATVASNKTWTANSSGGGIVVNGTLNLADATAALSGAVSGSGTIACADCLPNNAGLAAAGWTGLVTVNGGTTTAAGIAAADAASFMNAGSSFTVASGTVVLGTGAGLTGKVNVLASATLIVVDNSTTALVLNGTVAGNVNLTACTALETLTVNLGDNRNASIAAPSGLATLNLNLVETFADDGVIRVAVGNVPDAAISATITDMNGTTRAGQVAFSGSTAEVTFAPTVSGQASWCDYELNGDLSNNGTDTTALSYDTGMNAGNSFYNDVVLYTYTHPYRDMKDANAYPESWTAVVRCTVPNYEDAAVITFGTRPAGLIGLVAGADPETEMRLVQTTGDRHYVTNATMTVQNATTAQHVYIFSVETNQTVKVYCDGEMVLDKTFASRFTLGGGLQVGSVHSGVGSTGIVRFGKGESPANTLSETEQLNARIDCVRLFRGILGPNAIAQLSVEFPAVKLYRATIADDTVTDWNLLSWTPAWDGGNAYSKVILTVEDDAPLTLPASIAAEDFTIDVAEGKTLTVTQASGGTTLSLVNPMEVNGGTVAFNEDLGFGDIQIDGTGTIRLGDGVKVDEAISGLAKVEIPSGATVTVVAGGSIANTITGAGTLDFAVIPEGVVFNFSEWTGTTRLSVPSSGVSLAALPAAGNVVLKVSDESLADGDYALVTSTAALPANFATAFTVEAPTASETSLVSLDNRTIRLLAGAQPSLCVWTGKALDGKTDTAGNWLGNAKPTAGSAVYFPTATAAAIDNDIAGFAPASITFGPGAGVVTVGGNAITGVAAVTNLSDNTQTFECPVAFADRIFVSQKAKGWDSRAQSSVRFAGGVTGTTFADGTARFLNGAYNLSTAEDWVANTHNDDTRWGIPQGSSLTVPSAASTVELAIGQGDNVAGGAFTAGVVRTTGRICCWNKGEYVVTNELVFTLPGADRHVSYQSSDGAFKFEKITLGDQGANKWLYFANEGNYNYTKNIWIGAGGLNFAEGASANTAYACGLRENDVVYLRPWYSDYTIATKPGSTTDFVVYHETHIGTDDENGVARTVTCNGRIRSIGTGRAIVEGSGTFVVNGLAKTDSNNDNGTWTVTGGATLALAPGANLGIGVATVNSGATLAVTESGTVALDGGLTLADGAILGFNFTQKKVAPVLDLTGKTVTVNGVVKVKASGIYPGGKSYTLTSGGKFTGATVELAEGSAEWAKGVSVDENGDIVLRIKLTGIYILVR